MLLKKLDYVLMVLFYGVAQRRSTIFVLCVHVCTLDNQQLYAEAIVAN
jgi:hypothetical protein